MGRGAAYWRCMQRTLKLLIAFGRQPQRRVVLLSPHSPSCLPPSPLSVPLFGSAATPTVCLVLLLLLLPLFLQLHENELHSHTHTHSYTLAHTRHRKHTLVLSHKMCDVYLPLRPTRLCRSTCELAVSLSIPLPHSLRTSISLPLSLCSTVFARFNKHTCSTTFETKSRQIFALNMP